MCTVHRLGLGLNRSICNFKSIKPILLVVVHPRSVNGLDSAAHWQGQFLIQKIFKRSVRWPHATDSFMKGGCTSDCSDCTGKWIGFSRGLAHLVIAGMAEASHVVSL
jgi:hypothetical protein